MREMNFISQEEMFKCSFEGCVVRERFCDFVQPMRREARGKKSVLCAGGVFESA